MQLGDNPAHDEFSSFLKRLATCFMRSAEIEYNAFVNASDWQIHCRRQGLIEEGETRPPQPKLTPELRDAGRARLGPSALSQPAPSRGIDISLCGQRDSHNPLDFQSNSRV